ncbi:sce7726 family protein [Aeromonas salmonicida]|uniref:sce7726 family protein n=1 Tax=Aeromonas salmonicida TaxID=645 RepID=UPI003D204609
MKLNDAEIRQALILRLKNQAIKPQAIMEELRVHNGQAIADVVALYREAHCYEIKGENDKIERVSIQGKYYNAAFRKITLVVTQSDLEKAKSITPSFWGIMVAFVSGDIVKIKHIRKAKINPLFRKDIAVLTLWKSEMLSIIESDGTKNKNREYLANLIAASKKKSELSSNISQLLLNRHVSLNIK